VLARGPFWRSDEFLTKQVGKIPDLFAGISVGQPLLSVVMIRQDGAPSIFMGRTPHEVRDEMCRHVGVL